MLVLSRLINEKIIVDGPCTITVVQIRGNKVRLGFDAEPEILIMRSELLAKSPKQKDRLRP